MSMRQTVEIYVPDGYKNATEFLRDCNFEPVYLPGPINKDENMAPKSIAPIDNGSMYGEYMPVTVQTSSDAMELAYGLLWMVGCDRSTKRGEALYLARRALYEKMSRDGQARGITAARSALGV